MPITSPTADLAAMEARKDAAYAERDQVVALCAKMARAMGLRVGMGLHPEDDKDWDPEWRHIVYIDLPTGQVSWHVRDSEMPLFAGVDEYPGTFDGHDTPTKYARCLQAFRPKDKAGGPADLPDPEQGNFYRKTMPYVWAIQIDHAFTVQTLEGEVTGDAGDYLCRGLTGETWPVDRRVFEALYEPVLHR